MKTTSLNGKWSIPSTLAADDKTVILFYAGIQVYYTQDNEHATNMTNKYERMDTTLT